MDEKEDEIVEPEVVCEVSNDVKLRKKNAVMENTLIEARYSLTVEEQRLILATVAMLDSMETAKNGFPMLKIPKKLIIEATGIHEKNYHQIKTALRRLMQRVIEIETEKGFELYQWFSKAKYNKGEEHIEVQFHPDLKPYLLELKERFTKIPLKYVLQLRSKYAIRLYELLKQYENTGFRTDYIRELRFKLGIKKDEYTRFFDFERRVLAPSVKEINEKTDIEVSYEKKKAGRKITHIEFTIKSKPKESDIVGEKNSILKLEMSIQENSKKIEKRNLEYVWKEIEKYRKKYRNIIDNIMMYARSLKSQRKINELTENQLLFLFLNIDKDFYDEDFIVSVIKDAIVNSNIKNIMGYLIDTFDIDIKSAEFTELIKTKDKIDEEIQIINFFLENKSAVSLLNDYFKDIVRYRFKNGEISKEDVEFLKPHLLLAVVKDNIVYIPVKDSLEEGYMNLFIPEMIEFLKEKHGIDNIGLVYADIDKIKKKKQERFYTKADEK